MANPADIERARKGPQAWNEWAEANRGEQVDLSGETLTGIDFSGFVFPGNADFEGSTFEGDAKFGAATFLGDVDFGDVTFRANAEFYHATFQGEVLFFRAAFHRYAMFEEAKFRRDAWFQGVKFFDDADFWRAEFAGATKFTEAGFHRAVSFKDVAFRDSARFRAARFDSNAEFTGACFDRQFAATGARFDVPPDFRRVALPHALDLDEVVVSPAVPPGTQEDVLQIWRALKRLAGDANNNRLELECFAGEQRARRRVDWGLARYGTVFISWVYEVTSNYGRSWLRPLVWWAFVALLAALGHLATVSPGAISACAEAGQVLPRLTYLVLSSALVLPEFFASDGGLVAFQCIHGTALAPLWPTWLGFAHTAVSALLLFFVLLALRNLFRLR